MPQGWLGCFPNCCHRGFSDAFEWTDTCVQRQGLHRVWASRTSFSVGQIGELVHGRSVSYAKSASPERGVWHTCWTGHLREALDDYWCSLVPTKLAIRCRT